MDSNCVEALRLDSLFRTPRGRPRGQIFIVFHKNFINLKFLEDSNEITITAPITIGFPITDHLSATINTNLGSWTANTKKANISHSIINKIPTTLGFTYNINQSIDINANVGVVTYFNKKFNKKVTNSFNFGIGISYTSNVI